MRPFRAEQQCRATSTANHTLVDLLCVQSSRQTQNQRKSRHDARCLAASIAGPICGRTHDCNGDMTEQTKSQRTPSRHSFEVSVSTRPAIPVRRRCRLGHCSLRKLVDILTKTCCVLARFLLCRRRKRDFNVCVAASPLSRRWQLTDARFHAKLVSRTVNTHIEKHIGGTRRRSIERPERGDPSQRKTRGRHPVRVNRHMQLVR